MNNEYEIYCWTEIFLPLSFKQQEITNYDYLAIFLFSSLLMFCCLSTLNNNNNNNYKIINSDLKESSGEKYLSIKI